MSFEHTATQALNIHLSDFCKVYNKKYPRNKISETEFNILHDFVNYLSPIEQVKKMVEAST